MKLSIVVPCHQRNDQDERYLVDLLESIPDRKDVEVILVDDHSPVPLQIKRRFKETHLSIVPSNERTAGAARNAGIDNALGEWIVFSDSDDLFPFDAINLMIKAADVTCDVIIGHLGAFNNYKTSPRADTYNALLSLAKKDKRFLLRFYPPYGKVIKSAFIKNNELKFSHTQVSNDVLFNQQLFFAKPRIGFVEETVYRIRDHPRSLTKQKTLSSVKLRIEVLECYNRLLRENGFGAYQVERIKQLRSLYYRPIFVLLSLWRGWRLGEPIFLTAVSKTIQAEKKRVASM
jgi:glycosyltransferase involved in cell wall biosynthesis